MKLHDVEPRVKRLDARWLLQEHSHPREQLFAVSLHDGQRESSSCPGRLVQHTLN
jgi:hypothetical protein